MLKILRIDEYKDGGTIIVDCDIQLPNKELKGEYEICLLQSKNDGEQGKLFYGHPDNNDEITDADVKEYFLITLQQYKEYQNNKIDIILNAFIDGTN